MKLPKRDKPYEHFPSIWHPSRTLIHHGSRVIGTVVGWNKTAFTNQPTRLSNTSCSHWIHEHGSTNLSFGCTCKLLVDIRDIYLIRKIIIRAR